MNIKTRFQPTTKTDLQRDLFSKINTAVETFWQTVLHIYNENSTTSKLSYYIQAVKVFNASYPDYNSQFRVVFLESALNKTNVNLYTRSYNKINMIDMLRNRHPEYKTANDNGFIKFQYNWLILTEMFKEQLYMMLAQYGNSLNYLQILVSYTKLTIEHFNITEVNWPEALDLFKYIILTVEVDEIITGAKFYGNKRSRTRRPGLNYNSKSDRLVMQVFEMQQRGCSKKEIYETLGISRRTLYNMISKNVILQNTK